MARGLNKVQVIGNLAADPELRYTGSGTAVCNMRIGINESYKDRDGELVDKTEWLNLVAWGRLAEICGEYLSKGKKIYAEGGLQTRSYDDKDGNIKYVTEVKMKEMLMLSGGQGGGESNDSTRKSTSGGGTQEKNYSAPANSFEPDDDLPF